MIPWTQHTLPYTDITVGPCAWRLSMLVGEHADYVHAHPSLIVVDPADEDGLLDQAGRCLGDLPVLLGVAEPAFARQLEAGIRKRMQALGREHLEALVLHADDPAEIKSGGMLQTMFTLREQGELGNIGLAHTDPRAVEWLAINTAVRVLGISYSLEDQSAAYRALSAIDEYNMSAYTLTCPGGDEAIRFALGRTGCVLPVLDKPIPEGLEPMTADEAENAWKNYKNLHAPPPPLKRGLPPILEG